MIQLVVTLQKPRIKFHSCFVVSLLLADTQSVVRVENQPFWMSTILQEQFIKYVACQEFLIGC